MYVYTCAQVIDVTFSEASGVLEQNENLNALSAKKIWPYTINVDMRLFQPPPPGWFTKTLIQAQIENWMSRDSNGQLRFNASLMGNAWLMVDDVSVGPLTDDAILSGLTKSTKQSELTFAAYVIAGRHSTHTACKLLEIGQFSEEEMKRPSFVWRKSGLSQKECLTLGSAENLSRVISRVWEPVFIDQVWYGMTLLLHWTFLSRD